MSAVDIPHMVACPACIPGPDIVEQPLPPARLMLSLPTAHCAACISTVEAAMLSAPGVLSARVNLTQKRVSVQAEAGVTAADMVRLLHGVGFEAHELDPGLLSSTETDRQSRELLMRLGVAFFSMMNIMLLSVAVWSGAEAATRDMFHWISAAIAIPTVIFVGQPFFRSAWAALQPRRPAASPARRPPQRRPLPSPWGRSAPQPSPDRRQRPDRRSGWYGSGGHAGGAHKGA